MSTKTVRYVGPTQTGVFVEEAGLRCRPEGSPPVYVLDDQDVEHEIPTSIEVDEDLADRLTAQDIWEEVASTKPSPPETTTDQTDAAASQDTWPQRKGGGVYELSDGTTVRGRDAATTAQEQLDQE